MPNHDQRPGRRPAGLDSPPSDLAARIRGQIERRTGGQVRDLHVSCSGGRVVLRGRSRTYFAKQVAQESAFDLAGGPVELANDIVVCKP